MIIQPERSDRCFRSSQREKNTIKPHNNTKRIPNIPPSREKYSIMNGREARNMITAKVRRKPPCSSNPLCAGSIGKITEEDCLLFPCPLDITVPQSQFSFA